jgi:23S rRNA pseudouridine955/2504/2580 synthase
LKKNFNLKQDTERATHHAPRGALHAYSLSFTLMNGAPITVEAPYPKDFGVLVKLLEKNN